MAQETFLSLDPQACGLSPELSGDMKQRLDGKPAGLTAESDSLSELDDVAVGAALDPSTRRLGRSLSIRHVDAGSCNGCELEIHALNNPFYDLERFGLRFVASPRHADRRAPGHRTGDEEHARGAGTHIRRHTGPEMGCGGR